MQNNDIKPFDMPYVMRTTFTHMLKSVNISIDKTAARMEEFSEDPDKSTEVFKTLAALHKVRAALEEYQKGNPDQFRGN